MNDYEAYRETYCHLPNYCTCLQCQYWEDNNCDLSRTPDWQLPKKDDEE